MSEFLKPWMTKCNPDLIYRLWARKGCPGTLTLRKFGVTVEHRKTCWGVLCVKKLARLKTWRNLDAVLGSYLKKEKA